MQSMFRFAYKYSKAAVHSHTLHACTHAYSPQSHTITLRQQSIVKQSYSKAAVRRRGDDRGASINTSCGRSINLKWCQYAVTSGCVLFHLAAHSSFALTFSASSFNVESSALINGCQGGRLGPEAGGYLATGTRDSTSFPGATLFVEDNRCVWNSCL